MCKIVTVIRSANYASKFLSNAIIVKLHCNYTVVTIALRLHYFNCMIN